ncbi:S1 family peptidase [Tundrisphaera lichenicola]|uniref:S1 family peptidase n=1 Tax=Tundrisphaera lichenicola TaxID=2029860 RepID=UPI003EBFE294
MRGIRRLVWLVPALLLVAGIRPAPIASAESSKPGDDDTFRPTVMVHKGKALGTGTVIASLEGVTLVLTASHVVEDPGPLTVDLNRFNLGLEKTRGGGAFPRSLRATIAARDPATDLAVLEIRGQLALPYVAKMARGDFPPAPGTVVTSIGFDLGQKLIGMTTTVRAIEQIDLGKGGGHRRFLVTENPPEHGRSGGGLFRTDGALVGVCTAKAEFDKGVVKGVFTTLGNIKALLRAHEDLTRTIILSNSRPKGPIR